MDGPDDDVSAGASVRVDVGGGGAATEIEQTRSIGRTDEPEPEIRDVPKSAPSYGARKRLLREKERGTFYDVLMSLF